MWECPDFFELDGSAVLLVSPQDMLPEGFEYHNGNGTLCLIGDYDEKTDTFTERYNQSVDYGIDFYAPQTVLTPDGRRIMIGWMQNWDTCNFRSQMGMSCMSGTEGCTRLQYGNSTSCGATGWITRMCWFPSRFIWRASAAGG